MTGGLHNTHHRLRGALGNDTLILHRHIITQRNTGILKLLPYLHIVVAGVLNEIDTLTHGTRQHIPETQSFIRGKGAVEIHTPFPLRHHRGQIHETLNGGCQFGDNLELTDTESALVQIIHLRGSGAHGKSCMAPGNAEPIKKIYTGGTRCAIHLHTLEGTLPQTQGITIPESIQLIFKG